MSTRLPLKDEVLARFCRQHHIRRLALFGSTLTGAAGRNSDIDLLVDFEPGQEPGLLGIAQAEAELSSILGRKVDLRTAQDLSRYFRAEVLSKAVVQYAQ
jgi:uncharacterized protein